MDQIVLLSGWSRPELWGTWTDGREAKLIVQIVSPINSPLELSGRMRAITDGRRPQKVDVVINGENVEHWTLSSGLNKRRAVIPVDVATRRQPMMVTFKILHPVAPSAISSSSDYRSLGIGVEEFRIDEKGRALK